MYQTKCTWNTYNMSASLLNILYWHNGSYGWGVDQVITVGTWSQVDCSIQQVVPWDWIILQGNPTTASKTEERRQFHLVNRSVSEKQTPPTPLDFSTKTSKLKLICYHQNPLKMHSWTLDMGLFVSITRIQFTDPDPACATDIWDHTIMIWDLEWNKHTIKRAILSRSTGHGIGVLVLD